ncbi:hypothetical protein Tco_0085493 [Tanacetum coccineum]
MFQALVLLQVDMTEVRIECTVKHTAAFAFNAAINEFHAPTGSTSRSFAHVVRVKAVIVELYYGHFQDSRIHFGSVEDGCSGQEWKEGYTQNHDKSFTASIPYSEHQLRQRQSNSLQDQQEQKTPETPAEGSSSH